MAKNILITCWFIDRMHGAVIYTAELGRYLSSLGYNVYCAGMAIDGKTAQFIRDSGVRVYRVDLLPMDIHYDIVWALHWPLLPYLIGKKLKYGRIVNACLSEFLPMERPLFFKENIDIILPLTDNLGETLKKQYGFGDNLIMTLSNTAPDEFFDVKKRLSSAPKKIAVVSNHPPKELLNIEPLLKKKGVHIEYYGFWNNNSVRITPELLSEFDVIISIGKTVQYALAMGIPVYNYDYFGGSGYITPENIDIEQAHNFSGRSFRTKKTAKEITDEIMSGYERACADTIALKKIAGSRYKLSVRISEILKTLDKLPKKPPVKITNDNRLYFDYCESMCVQSLMYEDTLASITWARKKPRGLARLWKHIRTFKF
ncbi:MAG: hypothetical protein FWE50_01035 [Alphaproteobacteria bacterium]|nr:hypothetical protein [Alphaproteobacteria bacterium]